MEILDRIDDGFPPQTLDWPARHTTFGPVYRGRRRTPLIKLHCSHHCGYCSVISCFCFEHRSRVIVQALRQIRIFYRN